MSRNPILEKRLAGYAWVGWVVFYVAVAIVVGRKPLAHTDCPVYYQASQDWWSGTDVYTHNHAIDGFLYFPQFAVLYTPFYLLGDPVGDLAWRGLAWVLYATGIWRISKTLSPQYAYVVFALATAAAMPQGIASLRNGQANLHIAGLMLQTAADLSQGRWWRASLWLVLGVVIKPIMIVMLLLSAAVYRPLIPRVALGLVLMAVSPFVAQHAGYVVAEFRAYYRVMQISSEPPNPYCNMRGLIRKLTGWTMSQTVFQQMSVLAAGFMLWLCLAARSRRPEPVRVFYLVGFAAVYLMLFNPRTESNSYVMLAPVVALPAAALIIVRRPRPAVWLYGMSFMLLCDGWAYKWTENWLKPLTCVIVWGLLIRQLLNPPTDIELTATAHSQDLPESLGPVPATT